MYNGKEMSKVVINNTSEWIKVNDDTYEKTYNIAKHEEKSFKVIVELKNRTMNITYSIENETLHGGKVVMNEIRKVEKYLNIVTNEINNHLNINYDMMFNRHFDDSEDYDNYDTDIIEIFYNEWIEDMIEFEGRNKFAYIQAYDDNEW